MNHLHLLRYCAAILCVCVLPGCISVNMTTAMQTVAPSVTSGVSKASTTMTTATVSPADSISITDTALPTSKLSPSDAPKAKFVWRECVPVLMLTGGLIVACTILLVTTLMLAWKVCQLSRRLRALGSHDDLISNSEYWIGTARKNKSKHKSEAAETSMLMTGFSQTQEPKDNGADKEDKGTATFDLGKKGEEKQALDTVTHAPQITAENPKEENPSAQVNNVEATAAESK